MEYNKLDVKEDSALKSILEDKKNFIFFITRYDYSDKAIGKYKINLCEGKNLYDNDKVAIDIYEKTNTVKLHCYSEGAKFHKIENVKKMEDTESCIVQIIDKWNGYFRD